MLPSWNKDIIIIIIINLVKMLYNHWAGALQTSKRIFLRCIIIVYYYKYFKHLPFEVSVNALNLSLNPLAVTDPSVVKTADMLEPYPL